MFLENEIKGAAPVRGYLVGTVGKVGRGWSLKESQKNRKNTLGTHMGLKGPVADDGKRSEMPLGMNEVGRCLLDFVCFFFKEEANKDRTQRPTSFMPKGISLRFPSSATVPPVQGACSQSFVQFLFLNFC